METVTLDLPTMYGDHHVVEVRRILLELSGVEDVYASSAFRVVEVSYDPEKLDADTIKASLEKAGYLGELPVPVESGAAADGQNAEELYFRRSSAYAQTAEVVSFAQKVGHAGRSLWPCPGLGIIQVTDEES